ncbi:MAG: hypothetical protein LQ344_001732 [Seirophora lacunosa]|nr:MAG: hypothetical protein LQ344_001732 [Seirophora lacunosa]
MTTRPRLVRVENHPGAAAVLEPLRVGVVELCAGPVSFEADGVGAAADAGDAQVAAGAEEAVALGDEVEAREFGGGGGVGKEGDEEEQGEEGNGEGE